MTNISNYDNDFWKIHWGPDEAKGDDKLNTYFVRIPEYEDLKDGKYRYIIGRKGTGKTAIIEQLTNEIDGKYNQFHKYLSLKNFPIQTIRGLKDKTLGDKSQFVPIWTFLILTELSKLIIKDQTAYPADSVAELSLFLRTNFPSGLGFTETLKTLEARENKVSVLTKWLGTEHKDSATLEMSSPIHYQKVTELLSQFIKSINSKCSYFILFDELDEGYAAGDKNLNLLLLALFRSVENTYLDLNGYLDFRPILTLRSDIFDNLQDNDLNKLDDFIINLRWTTESYSKYSLKDLVNARINASLNVKDPSDAWNCVSYNYDENLPRKIATVWDFVYNRTFERPRDIVKYMKICSKLNYKGKIGFNAVRDAEINYSEWFFKEFRDEIQSHLPIWLEASQAIIKIGDGVFTFDQIRKELDKDTNIKTYLESNNSSHELILARLYEFGLIGNLSSSGKWFFKYKDHNLPFNTEQKMLLHFGFTRKFRIRSY